VSEKIDAAKESVSSALGVEKKPNGPKEEKSTLDKLKAAPGDAIKALAGLPGKIGKQIDAMKAKHSDAKQLIASKNALQYGGRSDRGRGAVMQHMFRGSDNIEKSYAKVRNDLFAEGIGAGQLPRTSDDRKKRDETESAKKASVSSGGAQQIDKAFMAKVDKASAPELYDILKSVNQNDPGQIANLQYLEHEVARRLADAGARPMG
jgi:hypothetical protein